MAAFPENAVRDVLSQFWDDTLGDESELVKLAKPDATVTVDELQPTMDSLTAVTVLVPLEPIMGQALKQNLIKQGGYSSKEEFIDHLMERLRKLHLKGTAGQ